MNFYFNHGKVSPDVKISLADWERITRYLVPEWRYTLQLLFCIAATAVLTVMPGLFLLRIIDKAIPEKNLWQLALLVAGMVFSSLSTNLLAVWQGYIAIRLGQDVMLDIRTHMFDRLLRQSLRFYTNVRTAEALSRLQSDVGGIQAVVSNTLVNLASNLLTVVTTMIVIFLLDWRLAIVAMTILPAFILPTRKVGQMRGKVATLLQEANADFNSYVQERLSIGGYLLVRLFGTQERERMQFAEKAGTMRRLEIEQHAIGRWFLMFILSFGSVGPALIYLAGGYEAIKGALTTGTIVAFVNYLGRLYLPVSALVNAHVELITATALFRRIFGYLDLAIEPRIYDVSTEIAALQGALSFKSVFFGYDGPQGKLALDDVSFDIRPGQTVALVGPSGAGKTSVTYLASRLYDPVAGSVELDGIDLRAIAPDELPKWIASATQEAIFFHSTIKDSLLYAKPEASDEEIERACRLAQIYDVIAALPKRMMTVIGERGYKLSGGERQRLALARLALRDPKLIIFDEATSSLDYQSEAKINVALRTLLAGRSSLVIAHRLSTIMHADLILVMDGGRIVERGTHSELLAAGGLYKKLYREQFRRHPPEKI